MKNKTGALIVIAIFLLSMVPLVFAQEAADTKVRFHALEPAESQQAPQQIRQEFRESVRDTVRDSKDNKTLLATAGKDARNEIKNNVRERVTEVLEQKGPVAKQRIDLARERYNTAKGHYESARERYLNQKDRFNNAKESYASCKGNASEDCNEKRTDVKSLAKPHLLNAADLVITELERVKAKIESSETISEDEIAEMISDIEDKISEIQSAKETIESIDETSTNEEINEASRNIRASWEYSKMVLKKNLARMANAQLGNIIHRTEVLEKRLYDTRDRLEAQGRDVSIMDAMLDEFSQDLDRASEKYLEAKSIWSRANTPGEVDQAARQAQELLKEATAALNDARDSLRDVVRSIKQANDGNLEVADDSPDLPGDVDDDESQPQEPQPEESEEEV